VAVKPVAYYHSLVLPVVVGTPALVVGVTEHQAGLRGDLVHTSHVLRVGDDGEFETENTIYRKRKPS
jgi:hypothetical protein